MILEITIFLLCLFLRSDGSVQPAEPDGPPDSEPGLHQGGAHSHAWAMHCSDNKVCFIME